jgi:CPA1 family monovalent cation:H+ antiporter
LPDRGRRGDHRNIFWLEHAADADVDGVGGVVAGLIFARVTLWLLARVDAVPISVLLQFISTFAVWLIAQNIGLSAIITVVSHAMALARRAPARVDRRHRIASYAVWDVAVFVLNALAFLLIGLQLRGILTRCRTRTGAQTYSLRSPSARQ